MRREVLWGVGFAIATVFAVCPSYGAEEGPQRWEAASRPDEDVVRSVRLEEIPVLRHILWTSDSFRIDPVVAVDGYYYRFTIHTDHGDYKVTSVRKLIKRLREIEVMEAIRSSKQGNQLLAGLGASVKTVGRGVGQVVTQPAQTVKRVGAGTGRFLRVAGRLISRPFRDEERTNTGVDLALLGRGPAGSERRTLAHGLGVDVYTRNERLQEVLNRIARKRVVGKLPVGATMFALPGGSVFTLSLTPMGYDATTEELIRDNSPDELIRVLRTRYGESLGLRDAGSEHPLSRLLENPNYTPRQQAYVYRYLLDLRGVDDLEAALNFLALVNTPEQASVVCAQVELLSLLHQRGKALERFVPVHNTLGAQARDGTLVLVISIDTVRFQGDVPRSLQRSINAARRVEADRIAILSTGDIDAASRRLARQMGVMVFDNILAHETFQRPRHEGDPTVWGGAMADRGRTFEAKPRRAVEGSESADVPDPDLAATTLAPATSAEAATPAEPTPSAEPVDRPEVSPTAPAAGADPVPELME
jgi:hypothetical protein